MNARPAFPHDEQARDSAADANRRGRLPSEPPDITRYRNGPGSMPLPPSTWPKWSIADQHAAMHQGWFIDEGESCIRALKGDVPWPRLHWSCDQAAVAFVGARSLLGDDLAGRAFLFLADRCGVMEQAEYGMRNDG